MRSSIMSQTIGEEKRSYFISAPFLKFFIRKYEIKVYIPPSLSSITFHSDIFENVPSLSYRADINSMEINDIPLLAKYQRRGLGTKMLNIFEGICREKSIVRIFGDLDMRGDIEGRKRFFEKNGYTLDYSPEHSHSGWRASKNI